MRSLSLVLSLVVALCAAPVAAQAVNTSPKPNIVGSNGQVQPNGSSTDPQISQAIFSATGVTVTESTLTTFASAAEFPITILRGAMVETDASGYVSIRRNGLYRVSFAANCTGVTTEVGRVTAQISTDTGSNFAQISGADATSQFLTNSLTQNMAGIGYVAVNQTAAALAAGAVLVALRGSSSGAGDMTCKNGGGFFVERVDLLQPATYP